MTAEKLQEILRKHQLWLDCKPGGERADLSKANLSKADLSKANLSKANLSKADLSKANLSKANLSKANLSKANLSKANLSKANLSEANLSEANLSEANLSEAKELLSAVNFLEAHFERTENGYIAYKTFNGCYYAPSDWKIESGSVLTENVNFNRTEQCGCGINVAPLYWVRRNYSGYIWKVLIRWEWLAGVCVPYHSDGQIRCERVELIEIVK